VVEIEKSVKMSEQAQFVRVGKMRCVATGRPVAQDHAEGPHGNLTDFPGALNCRGLSASDPRPSRNVSGSAERDRCSPICDFFPKTESDFAALGRRTAFSSRRTTSVIGGNSEVSALRGSSQFDPEQTSVRVLHQPF
jgi:hypothetical protein